MTHESIRYRSGYEYVLVEDAEFQTEYRPMVKIVHGPITLDANGVLLLAAGYAWNGPSGDIDVPWTIPASAKHDAIYQLIRAGLLSPSSRILADTDYGATVTRDGGWRWTGWLRTNVLKRFARGASRPSAEPVVLSAP